MRCLDADERKKLLDLIIEAELVEITYARVGYPKPGAIYCTIQQRKREQDGDVSRTSDPAGSSTCDPRELFTSEAGFASEALHSSSS